MFVPELLPCVAVFAVGLSSVNDDVFVIAGTRFALHTHPIFIHVGSFLTATTVHRAEGDLAGVVGLAEGAAGTAAGGHVVAVDSVCLTAGKAAW